MEPTLWTVFQWHDHGDVGDLDPRSIFVVTAVEQQRLRVQSLTRTSRQLGVTEWQHIVSTDRGRVLSWGSPA